jgi:hypothetical protein
MQAYMHIYIRRKRFLFKCCKHMTFVFKQRSGPNPTYAKSLAPLKQIMLPCSRNASGGRALIPKAMACKPDDGDGNEDHWVSWPSNGITGGSTDGDGQLYFGGTARCARCVLCRCRPPLLLLCYTAYELIFGILWGSHPF